MIPHAAHAGGGDVAGAVAFALVVLAIGVITAVGLWMSRRR